MKINGCIRIPASLLFLLILLILVPLLAHADDQNTPVKLLAPKVDNSDNLCLYTLYVKTGAAGSVGTECHININLTDAEGNEILFNHLASYGHFDMNGTYFEEGNLDIFIKKDVCTFSAPICNINITSCQTKDEVKWLVDYVQVTATGPHIPPTTTVFYLREWLYVNSNRHKDNPYLAIGGCGQITCGPRRDKSYFLLGTSDGCLWSNCAQCANTDYVPQS